MITRVVKLHFEAHNIEAFKVLLAETLPIVRGFEGCAEVFAYQHTENPQVFFTISKWNAASDLARYRESEFFTLTWAKTKALFAEPAQAWSIEAVIA